MVAGEQPRENAILGGRYAIVRPIGAGGMGAVYEGTQLDLRRPVAIKVLLPHLAAQADLVERFRREAQAAATLTHPNIVHIIDYGASPGQPPYLVMEYLTGESLRAKVTRDGPVSAEMAAHFGAQLLSALAVAHRAGIIHRDVKPANVFLVRASSLGETVKLLDFGVAKVSDEGPLTFSGEVVGTLAYMAPEQALGMGVDARTDLYGVAATMFFALTGRRPIEERRTTNVIAMLQAGPPAVREIRPALDPALAAIVDRGLAREPAARFQTASEMESALVEWMLRAGTPEGMRRSASVRAITPSPSEVEIVPASLRTLSQSEPIGPTTRVEGRGSTARGPAVPGPVDSRSERPSPGSADPTPAPVHGPPRGAPSRIVTYVVGGLAALAIAGVAFTLGRTTHTAPPPGPTALGVSSAAIVAPPPATATSSIEPRGEPQAAPAESRSERPPPGAAERLSAAPSAAPPPVTKPTVVPPAPAPPAPKPPSVRVRLDQVLSYGSHTESWVTNQVSTRMGAVTGCYAASALPLDDWTQVSGFLAFSPAGKVYALQFVSESDPALRKCIERAFVGLDLGQPQNQRPPRVTVSGKRGAGP